MNYIYGIIVFVMLTSFQKMGTISLDKTEAKQAFEYLNNIRTQPEKYDSAFPFLKNSNISKTKLVWNDTLAKAAEQKAMDMAKRNYFAHVDQDGYGINYYLNKAGYQLNQSWLKYINANNFESLVKLAKNGEDAIALLIIDKGVPSLGHRNHLLGINEWNRNLKDIGIGFSKKEYEGEPPVTYVCVIIAKHDW